jgi:hypothetical protein
MATMTTPKTLTGTTAEERLGSVGITIGAQIDVRTLGALSHTYAIRIVLFFEEDLARNRTFDSVAEEFGAFPEFERPYIEVNRFLAFTRENDPSFEATMDAFPLKIEIVTAGESPSGSDGKSALFVTGLMPFLDELDVDAPPPEPGF